MNKAYSIVGICIVVVFGGILVWRSFSTKTLPIPVPPTPTNNQSLTETPNASPSATSQVEEASTPMKPKQYTSPPPMTINPTKAYTVAITTDKGVMNVKLNAKDTPITTNNFVFLAREGFYTNTIFHRIIKGFMIQGGDPQGTGMGGPGYKFADERVTRDYTRGMIAMANSGPNTNGSQFFIMHEDYALPKNYVIFGTIDLTDSASLATLDAIANAPAVDNGMGETSKPVIPTVLQSITAEEK